MGKQIHNLKYLKTFRKALRSNGTCAEAVLWTFLKGRQLYGMKFRRQHSIENYIVDFYCAEAHLIIEVDGEYHYTEAGQASDKLRDERLSSLGFTILRYDNKLVFEHIEGVLEEIAAWTSPVHKMTTSFYGRPLLLKEGPFLRSKNGGGHTRT